MPTLLGKLQEWQLATYKWDIHHLHNNRIPSMKKGAELGTHSDTVGTIEH